VFFLLAISNQLHVKPNFVYSVNFLSSNEVLAMLFNSSNPELSFSFRGWGLQKLHKSELHFTSPQTRKCSRAKYQLAAVMHLKAIDFFVFLFFHSFYFYNRFQYFILPIIAISHQSFRVIRSINWKSFAGIPLW